MDGLFKFLERLGITLAPLLATIWISGLLALTLPYCFKWFSAARPTVDANRGWLLLAVIGSSAYLAVLAVNRTARWLAGNYRTHRAQKTIEERLQKLTLPEKHILQQYLEKGTRTLEWDLENSVVASLVRYRILFYTASSGNMFRYPHDLNEQAWNYLQQHPELVATPNDLRRKPGPDDWMSR